MQAFVVACSRTIAAAVGEAKLLVTIGCAAPPDDGEADSGACTAGRCPVASLLSSKVAGRRRGLHSVDQGRRRVPGLFWRLGVARAC